MCHVCDDPAHENPGVSGRCAAKGIAADIELIPITGVNAAWQRLAAKDVRYRFVTDMQTLRA